jgi:DNA-binding MarR family transcriptional regulator
MEKHSPESTDRERESLPHLLLDALPVTMRVIAAQMRETQHGLTTAHMPVLAALNIKPRTQSELADMMSVSGATMSNTLTTLEDRGWIRRERSRDDRRLVHIEISEQGSHALHESIREMEIHLLRLVETLSDDERRRLTDGLHVLRDMFYRALGGQDKV